MKFTVERKVLIKMLKLLSVGGVARNDQLRIAAQAGRLTLTVKGMAGISLAAAIADEGVCFFRHKQLLPLLRACKAVKSLTMEINSQGIKLGGTTIGRGLWEISVFENPAIAPERLILNPPEIEGGGNPGQQRDFGF